MSFQLVTIMKENQRFIFDNARIKCGNLTVLTYQATMSSGAHNSVNFQLILDKFDINL